MRFAHLSIIRFVILLLSAICISSCGDSRNGTSPTESPSFSFSDLANPPVDYRPWVRWWWPGTDVADDELVREVALLAENGFGGAEIQPFDAALDPEATEDELARRRSFDTDSFYRQLSIVMEEALEQGLRIDLNLGSGWPTGGMHIPAEASLKTLLWSEHEVQGPGSREVDLKDPARPVFYLVAGLADLLFGEKMARYRGDLARLVAVVAARVTGGTRSKCPLDLTDRLELDPASVCVLTGQVDENGILIWEAPEGAWRVIGVYEAPNGEYPMLNAQLEPGYVLDHLNRAQVLAHLEHLFGTRTGMDAFYGMPFRGFFNDSLELKAERFYATDFLAAFQEKRGYDLTPWLPAVLVPGADNSTFDTAAIKRGPEFCLSAEDHRIRYDYTHTVSDLYIERFLENSVEWAEERGLLLRAQSYGLNIDTIRAAGAASIPETEQLYAGGSEMFLKMVSSGAMLYGRRVVSAESLVWIGRAYMTTPYKIKVSADKMFCSGINQIVFHGFPYQKNHAYGETGWHPFASPFGGFNAVSSNISEASSFWRFMPRVNRYIARCQVALQQGDPAADLLVYYPWMGFQTTLAAVSDHHEFLLNGQLGELEPEVGLDELLEIGLSLGLSEIDPQVEWISARWPLLQELENSGYTWAWVNDECLEQARLQNGEIVMGNRRFKGLLVVEAPEMRSGTAARLAELAEGGAGIILAGEIPGRQPGFFNYQKGDSKVIQSMERVKKGERTCVLNSRKVASDALSSIGVLPELRFLSEGGSVRSLCRKVGGNGRVFFLWNPSFKTRTARFTVQGGCPNAWWVDVWNETSDPIQADGSGVFQARLPPHGSALLFCGLPTARDLKRLGFEPSREEIPPDQVFPLDAWSLDVKGEDVPEGEIHLQLDSFPDWRDLEELRYCSSPGIYSTGVELPAFAHEETVVLSLGWVHGAAEVWINGYHAGSLLAPPFRLEVSEYVNGGTNRIEIRVIPALQNRLNGWARSGDERYQQFVGKEDKLVPVGIQGPVAVEIGG